MCFLISDFGFATNVGSRAIATVKFISIGSIWENQFRNQEWGSYPPESVARISARNV